MTGLLTLDPGQDERPLLDRWFGSPEHLLKYALAFGVLAFAVRLGWILPEALAMRWLGWWRPRAPTYFNVAQESGPGSLRGG